MSMKKVFVSLSADELIVKEGWEGDEQNKYVEGPLGDVYEWLADVEEGDSFYVLRCRDWKDVMETTLEGYDLDDLMMIAEGIARDMEEEGQKEGIWEFVIFRMKVEKKRCEGEERWCVSPVAEVWSRKL